MQFDEAVAVASTAASLFWPPTYSKVLLEYGVPASIVDWLSPPYIGSSALTRPEENFRNYIGAATFVLYILAALLLTGLLVTTLTPRRRVGSLENGQIAVTLLSFTLLSSNMILFLVQSYRAYYESAGASTVNLQNLWRWMTCSTLFVDFARGLVTDPLQTWWATQALFATYLTFCYFRLAGGTLATTTKIALLGQILPPSFSLNLFYLNQEWTADQTEPQITSISALQLTTDLTLLLGYRGLLASLPSLAWSSNPLFFIAMIRLLLFVPWLANGTRQANSRAIERAMQTWAIMTLMLAFSSLEDLTTFITQSNAAARTLGLDAILWSISVLFHVSP